MGLSPRSLKGLALPAVVAALLAATGCVDIVGADMNRYVERDEKHFTVSGKPDVALTTFDGSIEIRPWDRSDVEVVIEKRGRDHADVAEIEVKAEQHGNRIEVSIVEPKRDRGFNLHFHNRSARLIVSMPASSDVAAKSGDGSIDIERIAGRVQLRSGDGSIRGRMLGGDVEANTGDGSIKLDGKLTGLQVHTGDGGIRLHDVTLSNVDGAIGKNTVRGRLGNGGHAVKVRTGDGSITLRRS